MHLTGCGSIERRLIACAALFCAIAALGSQAPSPPPSTPPPAPPQAAEWKTYSFPADGFSASFPTEPVKQKQSVDTDGGKFELRTYLAATDAVALYIGVCDYGEAANGGDPDAILEGAKNGAVSKVNAHLVDSKKITLGIYPGVDFEAAAEGAHFFGRIYLVGTTLYQAFVALPSDQAYPDTSRFLDSFQLIPRTSP